MLNLSIVALKGQTRQSWILHAKVIDCNNGRAIPYVDIFNESQRMGLYADSIGMFMIKVRVGDTLVLQSLGYISSVYIISKYNTNILDTLDLCPQIHDIGEVQIQLPHSYEAFKHQFLEIEPERRFRIEGLPEPKIIDIPALMDTNYLNSTAYAVFNPIDYLYYKYSKEEKSKRKVFYLERQKREELIINEKYNRGLIQEITGLKGDSITDFMFYCSFDHKFLYEATPLEIVQEIDMKFKEYSENNKILKLQDQ